MEHFIGLLSVMQRLICREDALFYLTQGKAKASSTMCLYCRLPRSSSPHRNIKRECVDRIRDSPDLDAIKAYNVSLLNFFILLYDRI